jgi:hypothetical protein
VRFSERGHGRTELPVVLYSVSTLLAIDRKSRQSVKFLCGHRAECRGTVSTVIASTAWQHTFLPGPSFGIVALYVIVAILCFCCNNAGLFRTQMCSKQFNTETVDPVMKTWRFHKKGKGLLDQLSCSKTVLHSVIWKLACESRGQ